MKIRLTEDKLHQLVYECVRRVLNEGKPGIQSQKLYDILQKYGGIKRSYEGSRANLLHHTSSKEAVEITLISINA